MVIKNKVLIVLAGVLILSACGGGGSSSGGGASKNVSHCVVKNKKEGSTYIGGTKLPSTYTFTNKCGFTVNLTTGFVTAGKTVSLAVNQSHETILATNYIACKPPSVGYDKNDDVAKLELTCS